MWEEGLEFGLIILQPDGKDQRPSYLTAGSEQVASMGSAAAAGFIPAAAIPAENVTACSSAIPTSKNLSGNIFLNRFKPVPSEIRHLFKEALLSFTKECCLETKIRW